jgi:hypothetical protein
MRSMVEGRLCVPHALRRAKSSLTRSEDRIAAGGRSALRAFGPISPFLTSSGEDYPCAPNSLAMAVEIRSDNSCARAIGVMKSRS